MAAKIHVGNVGVAFQTTFVDENGTAIDISGASTKQIIASHPDRVTNVYWPGSFITNGVDGGLQYVTNSSGDLPIGGDWRFQGFAIVGTNKWTTDITTVTIYSNVDTP